jgi:hypothetical protein
MWYLNADRGSEDFNPERSKKAVDDGRFGELMTAGILKQHGISIIRDLNAEGNHFRGGDFIINYGGKDYLLEVKTNAGKVGNRVYETWFLEVATTASYTSHTLTDLQTDIVAAYNIFSGKVHLFHARKLREAAKSKRTVLGASNCPGILIGWEEKASGHIITLENK